MRRMKVEAPDPADAIRQITQEMNDVMRRADGELKADRVRGARRVVFESANAPKEKPIPPGLAQIVESVFVADEEIAAVYRRAEAALAPSGDRLDYSSLLRALDEIDQVGWQARKLYATARIERETWERANEVNFASIRHEANLILQKEKDDKSRSKQITDKDVDTQCALIAPDEWQGQEAKRAKLKHTEDALGGLIEALASRARSLQVMIGKSR